MLLPGDVNPFADPPRTVDLLHHEVGNIGAGDAAAVARKSITVDAVGAVSGSVGQHRRHHHGPIEIALGEILLLRDLRCHGPFEEGVVNEILNNPPTPSRLLVER
jgi:hypothetical protein